MNILLLAMMLSEAVAGSGDTITVAGLLLLLGGLAAFVARITGKQAGKKEAQEVSVTNNPLRVELEKEFVRRDEWQTWRAEVRGDLGKLEAIMERIFDRVDTKHTDLLATIERAAKTGVDGRVALWNELREQGEKLAKVEGNVDVAKSIGQLAAELKEARRENQTKK